MRGAEGDASSFPLFSPPFPQAICPRKLLAGVSHRSGDGHRYPVPVPYARIEKIPSTRVPGRFPTSILP